MKFCCARKLFLVLGFVVVGVENFLVWGVYDFGMGFDVSTDIIYNKQGAVRVGESADDTIAKVYEPPPVDRLCLSTWR